MKFNDSIMIILITQLLHIIAFKCKKKFSASLSLSHSLTHSLSLSIGPLILSLSRSQVSLAASPAVSHPFSSSKCRWALPLSFGLSLSSGRRLSLSLSPSRYFSVLAPLPSS